MPRGSGSRASGGGGGRGSRNSGGNGTTQLIGGAQYMKQLQTAITQSNQNTKTLRQLHRTAQKWMGSGRQTKQQRAATGG